jgi:hypothetical protein
MAQTTEMTGGCLCRAVRYRVDGPLTPVVYCHCSQCRRTSGHFVAATAAPHERLTLTEQSGLAWYRSSDIARRGFCRECGSSVFWEPSHGKYMAVMAGTLDAPTGLISQEHIYTDDAGDYYAICDGLPQFAHDHEDLWEDEAR